MSKFTFFLELPAFLSQWFVHRCGGNIPVKLPKGSIESIIVQRFSVSKSKFDEQETRSNNAIEIEVPDSKAKPAEYYCYLSSKTKRLLIKSISDQFNLNLATDIVKTCFPISLKRELIETWMETNGIEFNETNWLAVEKRFSRLRESMLNSKRAIKTRKKT